VVDFGRLISPSVLFDVGGVNCQDVGGVDGQDVGDVSAAVQLG
jgi:hypothetical protein